MGVQGNERADKPAKEATENVNTQRYPKRLTLLAHVGCTISERNWKRTKHLFRTENDRHLVLQRAQYDTTLVSQEPDMTAIERAALVSRRYIHLRSGHAITVTYLQHI